MKRAHQGEVIARTHADPELKARRTSSILATMATPQFKARRSVLSKMLAPVFMETNRRNGSVRSSAGERAFAAWLQQVLGREALIHHPPNVNGFSIDIYLHAPIDAYVQFDGVYYHGLDRPYAALTSVIRRKYDRERLADKRFANLGLRLIRITDREWAAMASEPERMRWLDAIRDQADVE